MNLDQGDEIVGMQMNTQGEKLLIVTEKGMGKKTDISEFHLQRRGGKGLKCYKITEKTGNIVGVKAVNDEHEIMMITTEGIIIQLRCDEISTYSRITSGVKLINLKKGETVAKIAKVRDEAMTSNDEDSVETREASTENSEEVTEEITEENSKESAEGKTEE